jgi:hypothetical protein
MFKTDALQRYEDYLNEMVEVALIGELQKPDVYRKKYGVSAVLFQFLKKKGIFYLDDSGVWLTSRRDTFTTEEVSMLKNELNRYKYQIKTNGHEEENPPVRFNQEKDSIRSYSTKELLTELKRRGYSGEIFVSKSIKF